MPLKPIVRALVVPVLGLSLSGLGPQNPSPPAKRKRASKKSNPLNEWKYALVHAAAREHPFNPAICDGCGIVEKLLKGQRRAQERK